MQGGNWGGGDWQLGPRVAGSQVRGYGAELVVWVVGAGVGLSEHSVVQRVWSLLYTTVCHSLPYATALIFALSLRPEAELRGGQFGAVALRGVGSSPVHPQLRRPVAEGSHTACPRGPSSLGKKVWVDQRPPYRVIFIRLVTLREWSGHSAHPAQKTGLF